MNSIFLRITFKTISPPKIIQVTSVNPSYLLCQCLHWPLLPQMKSNLRRIDTVLNFIFSWRPSCCVLGRRAHLSVSPNRGQYIDNRALPRKSISMWPLMVFGFKCFVLCQCLETKRQSSLRQSHRRGQKWKVTDGGGAGGEWQHWYQHQ